MPSVCGSPPRPMRAWASAPGEADDPPLGGQRVPPLQGLGRPGEQRHERLGRPEGIVRQRGEQLPGGPVAPLTVGVDPFDAVERQAPGVPLQRRLRGVRVGHDAESTEPRNVGDDVTRIAAEGVRGLLHAQRDVVPAVGADLVVVEAEHARAVRRRVQGGPVTVVGDDDEREAGPRGGGGHLIDRAAAVGASGMDVVGPAHVGVIRRPGGPREDPGLRGQRGHDEGHDGGGEHRRRDQGNPESRHQSLVRAGPPAGLRGIRRRRRRGGRRRGRSVPR